MASTLTIEGLPAGWDITIADQRALRVGSTPSDPTILAVEGRVRFVASNGAERRSALLQVGSGANVVSWSEFRSQEAAPSGIAGVAVATAFAAVMYFGRRRKRNTNGLLR